MSNLPYVQMKGIRKIFGKVIANNNVNLEVNCGEVHALLGENGAGKSTLMNMLSGVYTPDGGSVFIHGKEVKFSSPKDAIKAGIGMIYQHFKLVEAMTAKENIVLGQKSGLFTNNNKVELKIKEISEKYGLDVDLNKKVQDMSVGEKQIVEILKVLYRGADILVLDEPTTVFTPQETEKLFAIMNKMKEQGCAIIFITHKMDEVMAVSDRITVLRKGETVATVKKENTNPKQLADLMVGHAVDLKINRVEGTYGNDILQIKALKVKDKEGTAVLKGIDIQVREGEILGLAGIANSGQKELCEAVVGIQSIHSGEIIFEGQSIVGKSTRQIIDKGISMSFIPEDRLGMGLVANMDMVDNIMLKDYHHQKGLLLNRKPVIEKAKRVKEELNVQTPGIHHQIRDLSGGNIQKILLGRELDSNPRLLIMAYPTRGLDINTCCTIYDLMNEQKKKGVGILFIAEDLDVLMQLSDKIAVLCNGEITGMVEPKKTTKEELGLLMVGQKSEKKEGEDIA